MTQRCFRHVHNFRSCLCKVWLLLVSCLYSFQPCNSSVNKKLKSHCIHVSRYLAMLKDQITCFFQSQVAMPSRLGCVITFVMSCSLCYFVSDLCLLHRSVLLPSQKEYNFRFREAKQFKFQSNLYKILPPSIKEYNSRFLITKIG